MKVKLLKEEPQIKNGASVLTIDRSLLSEVKGIEVDGTTIMFDGDVPVPINMISPNEVAENVASDVPFTWRDIHQSRVNQGLSVQDMAEEVGVTWATMKKVETGGGGSKATQEKFERYFKRPCYI